MRPSTLLGASVVLSLQVCLAVSPGTAADKHDVEVQRNVRVPMRDGVHLATDLYLPLQRGKPLGQKLPAVLLRTPYNKAAWGTGNVMVTLHVASDAPDTDFFVKLLDVYPPSSDYPHGYAFPVSEGILRARYRNGFEKPQLMQPGEIYRLRFPLEPTANRFQAGHRIRVDVCSSNFPNFDINPNTGDPNNRHPRVAANTLYHHAAHASFLELPVFATKPSHHNPGNAAPPLPWTIAPFTHRAAARGITGDGT